MYVYIYMYIDTYNHTHTHVHIHVHKTLGAHVYHDIYGSPVAWTNKMSMKTNRISPKHPKASVERAT